MHPTQAKRLRGPAHGSITRWWPLLALVVIVTSAAAQGQSAEDDADQESFQVVIHAENPTTELTATMVSRMFLKRLKRWPHGVRVMPIDLQAKSPIRKDFTRSVHKKSVTAIKSFWQRMIFSGRGDPPPLEESSEEAVLDFVRSNPGAIGYVAASTSLGDGVKKLKVSP